MKDYIQIGVDKGLISYYEDRSRICYNWQKAELTTNIPYDSIVDGETLKNVTPVITFRETRIYNEVDY